MGTYPIIALFIIAAVSLLVVRLGAAAFMITGLPRTTARFQALSAFFGVGFTTQEAELVVEHPVRRRIASYLIVIGNLGITSALATFIVAIMAQPKPHGAAESPASHWALTFGLTIGGVVGLFMFLNLPPIRNAIEAALRKSLQTSGVIRPTDYDSVLKTSRGFVLSEIEVEEGSPLAGRTLAHSRLKQRGVIVLGIARVDSSYVGTPKGEDIVEAGDLLTAYGREEHLGAVTRPDGGAPTETGSNEDGGPA